MKNSRKKIIKVASHVHGVYSRGRISHVVNDKQCKSRKKHNFTMSKRHITSKNKSKIPQDEEKCSGTTLKRGFFKAPGTRNEKQQ